MYLCTIRCGDREGSQRYQPRKESGNLNSTRRIIPKDLIPNKRMLSQSPCLLRPFSLCQKGLAKPQWEELGGNGKDGRRMLSWFGLGESIPSQQLAQGCVRMMLKTLWCFGCCWVLHILNQEFSSSASEEVPKQDEGAELGQWPWKGKFHSIKPMFSAWTGQLPEWDTQGSGTGSGICQSGEQLFVLLLIINIYYHDILLCFRILHHNILLCFHS